MSFMRYKLPASHLRSVRDAAPMASAIMRTGRLCSFGRMSRRKSTRSSDPSSRHATTALRCCEAVAARRRWASRRRCRIVAGCAHGGDLSRAPGSETPASPRRCASISPIGEALIAVYALADRELSAAAAAGIGSRRDRHRSNGLRRSRRRDRPHPHLDPGAIDDGGSPDRRRDMPRPLFARRATCRATFSA